MESLGLDHKRTVPINIKRLLAVASAICASLSLFAQEATRDVRTDVGTLDRESAAGLPQTAIPMALLFFNVGVEMGQLLFIAAALSCLALAGVCAQQLQGRLVSAPADSFMRFVPSYAIGCVAMFWLIQRVAEF